MAAYTRVDTAVKKSATGKSKQGIAGQEIEAGEWVALKASDGLLWLADANDSTLTDLRGVAEQHAFANQPLQYCYEDTAFETGGDLANGDVAFLSPVAGLIVPHIDLSATDFPFFVGTGITGGKLKFKIDSMNIGTAIGS